MTRIRATDPGAGREDYDVWRGELQLALDPTDTVGARPWSELRDLEIFPGSRLGDPTIVVPESYLPRSVVRRLSFRTVDLSALPYMAERTVDEAVRRALLALWLPRGTSTGVRVYKPSVWLIGAQRVIRIAGWIHDRRGFPDGRVFAGLTRQEVAHLLAGCRDDRERSDTALLLRNLRDAGERGLLTDYPLDLSEKHDVPSGEFVPEASLKDRAAVEVKPPKEESPWQPLPDDFVTELVGRAIWIQENLASQILTVIKRGTLTPV